MGLKTTAGKVGKSATTITPLSQRLLTGTEHQFREISQMIAVPQNPFDTELFIHSKRALKLLDFNKLVNSLTVERKSLLLDIILDSIGIEDPNSKLIDLIEFNIIKFRKTVPEEKIEKIRLALIEQYNRKFASVPSQHNVEASATVNDESPTEVEQ